jgi:hypothetical protein
MENHTHTHTQALKVYKSNLKAKEEAAEKLEEQAAEEQKQAVKEFKAAQVMGRAPEKQNRECVRRESEKERERERAGCQGVHGSSGSEESGSKYGNPHAQTY